MFAWRVRGGTKRRDEAARFRPERLDGSTKSAAKRRPARLKFHDYIDHYLQAIKDMPLNYYEILGIDRSADSQSIEQALGRKRIEWSKGTRNPKTKIQYQKYLDVIPEIKRSLLSDAEGRKAYDAELDALARKEKLERIEEFERRVRLRSAKGGLSSTDRDELRALAAKFAIDDQSFESITRHIADFAEPPRTQTPPEPAPDVQDKTTRRMIKDVLDQIQKNNLYEVLDLPRGASLDQIKTSAEELRKQWNNKSQTTAEKTAWLDAATFAQSHLCDPQKRARYDRTLVHMAEEEFQDAAKFAIGVLRALDDGTKRELLFEASRKGIEANRAEILMKRLCKDLDVEWDSARAAWYADAAVVDRRELRCYSCFGLTDHAKVARESQPECRHCRGSLKWECPSCKTAHWVDKKRCDCGFLEINRIPLLRRFEAARRAEKIRDYHAALAHLEVVRSYAPNHVGARNGIEIVKTKLAEIDRAIEAYQSELSRKRLVKALEYVDEWIKLVHAGEERSHAARRELAEKLREAQALAASATVLAPTDPASARKLFRDSLAIAADLAEAREGLAHCPPEPPPKIVAIVDRDRFRIRWAAAPDHSGSTPLRYRVVRKWRGLPAGIHDGDTIAETEKTGCDDRTAIPGEYYGYSVFTLKGSTHSPRGATTSTQFPALFDPADVRIEASQGKIDLSWKLPEQAARARVVRKIGSPPVNSEDGVQIDCSREHASDTGLKEDCTYHYLIKSEFKLADGRRGISLGVAVSAIPQSPPVAVEGLTLKREADGRLRISWKNPDFTTTRILRSLRPPGLLPGEAIDPRDLDKLEGEQIENASNEIAFDQIPDDMWICYYTPFSIRGGRAAAGRSTAFSCLEDPAELRAARIDGSLRVHLRWRWNSRAAQSVVVVKAGEGPISPEDPSALVEVVSEDEYSRSGYHAITLPQGVAGPWRVRVFSVIAIDGSRFYSPGIDPTAETVVPGPTPEIELAYSILHPVFPGKGRRIAYQTRPAGASIPPTILVAHPRAVPLSCDDGEIVERFPATRDGAELPIHAKVKLKRDRVRVFVDPTASVNGSPPIRVRHPDADGVRV